MLQWKKYLTTMQIVQFLIDLVAVYFGSAYHMRSLPCQTDTDQYIAYSYFVATYWSGKFPAYGTCAGTPGAAVFGCVLLTSYLGLFINFYIQTYKKPTAKGKKTTMNGNGNRVGAE